MYRTIDTALWTDPKVRKLTPEAKLLFLYLITNSHTHVSGIYYLPMEYISHEIGLSAKVIAAAMDTLSVGYLAQYDRVSEVVWVVKMLDRQGHGPKNDSAVAIQLRSLHNCPLIKPFLEQYAHRKIPYHIPYSDFSLRNRNRIQEQEQEEPPSSEADEAPPATPATETPLANPTRVAWDNSGHGQFVLPDGKLEEWQETYPDLDVGRELAKAEQWYRDNPDRRKKAHQRFLGSWMSRADQRAKEEAGPITNPLPDFRPWTPADDPPGWFKGDKAKEA